jgi:hypothetical protein
MVGWFGVGEGWRREGLSRFYKKGRGNIFTDYPAGHVF